MNPFANIFPFAAVCLGLCSCMMGAVKTETVQYTLNNQTFKGYVAYDDAGGKHPGILIAPEWWGLNDYVKGRAEQLAKLGYVAFVADMYGDDMVTTDPKQAGAWSTPLMKDRSTMRGRISAALNQLKKRDDVDGDKIAAIGYCFGGTCVLELARSGAPIAGVVTFHGNLSNPNPNDDKNIKAKVLVCAGAADPMVTEKDREEFQKNMADAKVNWEMDIYADAEHAFTNPNAGKYGVPGVMYNEQADVRSFQRMQNFFAELFH